MSHSSNKLPVYLNCMTENKNVLLARLKKITKITFQLLKGSLCVYNILALRINLIKKIIITIIL